MNTEHQIILFNFKFTMDLINYIFEENLKSWNIVKQWYYSPPLFVLGAMICFESNPLPRCDLAVKMA